MAVQSLLCCVLSLLFVCVIGETGALIRNTTIGEVKGIFVEFANVTKYLGIPYAEAPVGELRFKPPVRKSKMEGVFNATSNTFICPQPFDYQRPTFVPVQTENCLRLSVFAPLAAMKSKPLPVMVWIHGGGYVGGDANSFDGTFLAAHGQVIVVTLNYRLGILGFLNTMDDNAVGNFGLRDQCLAIEWVVDNIEEFGGNVSQITIFGESAGASSGLQLAMSTLCVGQFQRVIAQSGSADAPWTFNKDPKKSFEKLAADSGCPKDPSALVKCLKTKTIQELNGYQMDGSSILEIPDWVPTYSKDIFPDSPVEITKGKDSPSLRRFRSLDVLTGLCYEEGELEYRVSAAGVLNLTTLEPTESQDETFPTFEITEDQAKLSDSQFHQKLNKYLEIFLEMNPKEREELFPIIKFHFTDWKNRMDAFANTRSVIQFESDIKYNLGAIRSANSHSSGDSGSGDVAGQGATYFYQLRPQPSWQPDRPWQDGASHTDDISFVFGFVQFLNSSAAEKQLEIDVMTYWTNFAKSGSPNQPEPVSLIWPMYDKQSQKYLQLDLSSKVHMYPYARRFAFWDGYFLPTLQELRDEKEEEKPKVETCSGMTLLYSSGLGICILFSLFYDLL